jgi:K+/H+ antiporter YhaU regulatory subunit KhtT
METGHTVILGWSEQIFTILPELIAANASEQRSCVVILGEREKVAMEDEIRTKVGSTGRTRVVCRTGNPMDRADLNIASLITAKSILILSPLSSNPDADVFKVVLAILNHPDRRKGPYHIVAGLRDPKNTGIAKVIGKDEVEWIQMGSIVSRIIAQTCRQSGLSILYSELLDFGGNEIYFHEEPALVGKTFGQALLAAEKDSVIGIFPKGQKPRLGPPMDTPLRTGDQVIVIAKDDRLIAFDPDHTPTAKKAALSTKSKAAAKPEHTLILGWNWRGPGNHELDYYVARDRMCLWSPIVGDIRSH